MKVKGDGSFIYVFIHLTGFQRSCALPPTENVKVNKITFLHMAQCREREFQWAII